MVKRRPDLEENDQQLASLKAGLPGKKKLLYMVAYRQHSSLLSSLGRGLGNDRQCSPLH